MTDNDTNTTELFASASFGVIYVYSVPNVPAFEGRVKIGDTTLPPSIQRPEDATQDVLEKAARKRIDSYTKTTDLEYTLEHVELAVRPVNLNDESEGIEGFRDYKIHALLKRNGHKKSFARKDKKSGEWFEISVATAKEAIAKYKAHEEFLGIAKANIVLRPEQEAAVAQTLKVFKNGSIDNSKKMLWNAKMRFGKTLTSYELVKKLDEKQGIKKVLIITHRPDVNESWTADYRISGLKELGWRFGSKKNDVSWNEVSKNEKFIWFASIQDLRGSYSANNLSEADFQKLKKNQELFATEFDLLITDEAHEGNMTELARRMTKELKASYMLDLSGTPFNLLQAEAWDDELAIRFNYDGNIYNWSYPDERRAKRQWAEEHPEEPNPYAELPEMKWITYDISQGIKEISGNANAGVSFNELFRVVSDSNGKPVTPMKFVHEEQVRDLLSKIRGDKKYSDDPRLFPYNRNFENQFNHTLWMLPSVPACEAMKNLLGDSETGFDAYEVVNATGNGSAQWSEDNALETVKKAIKGHKKTITLSYRMLTTGVTVKEWTAVFMLNNVSNPMAYMQTAFRAASPGSLADGRIKETAYVFDFNPDRCLRQIVETAKWNAPTPDEAKGTEQEGLTQTELDEAAVKDYLNYISILSLKGSTFIEPDSAAIMDRLNEVYVNEVVAKGFDSPLLWNNKELVNFDIKRVKILEALRKLEGSSADKRAGEVVVSTYDEETAARHKELAKAAREARNDANAPKPTPEERAELKELEKEKAKEAKNRSNAIGVLVGIAARMPMLVFAAPSEERITPSNFAELIDEQSWQEFMPKNLKRVMPEGVKSLDEDPERLSGDENSNILYWDDVKRFFNDEIFWRASERIRDIARNIETKGILERKFRKDMLFTMFRNPDKETVLTPARVVELQYTKTLGGLNFYDLEQSTAKEWYVFVKNLETGEQEVHEAHQVLRMLDEGTHELSPRWVTSEVDEKYGDRKGFWEDRGLSVYDINSKTALYPLYAATSAWYANREAFYELNEDSGLTREELDDKLWEDTVEKAIFLNTRVPYSASIARRVLTGFDARLSTAFAKNLTTIDVIGLKRELDGWNSLKKAERPDYWAPFENVHEAIGVLLRIANRGFVEVHCNETVNGCLFNAVVAPSGAVSRITPYLQLLQILGKINESIMTKTDLHTLRKLVDSVKNDVSRFEAVVGNPPYQIAAGASAPPSVYQHFAFIAFSISKFSSLIHPARWLYEGVRGEGLDKLRSSLLFESFTQSMEIFDSSDELFESATVAGGLVIYLVDKTKVLHGFDLHKNGSVTRYTEKESGPIAQIIDPKSRIIAQKVNAVRSFDQIMTPRAYYGDHLYGTRDIEKIPSVKDGIEIFLIGKSGLETKTISRESTLRDTSDWKIAVSKTAHSISGRSLPRPDRAFIMAPDQICSGTFHKGGSFKTENEAINALRYLKTTFSTYLLAVRVPSHIMRRNSYLLIPLIDFSTGEILDKPGTFLDFSKPETLDDQLAEIYELTDEERELMRKDLKPWKDKIDVEADK